ncbi:MAG: glycosyltransferase family 2 protein [Rikenellaceae bacterium]|nr:glycosyltransferase family 2 protein [Rikenellaceae bacterium]
MSKTKVVIVNWNGRAHLERYFPSVVRHTMPQYGVVVADNGSTDSSLEYVAETFPEVEIVRLDRNYGFAEGYNRALQEIEAEYYVLLNSDVEVTEGWCEKLVEALDADPQLAAVAPKLLADTDRERFEYAGASGGFIDILGYPFCRGRILSTTELDEGQYDDPREVFWASGAAFACRAEVFKSEGGFDAEFFAHMEEIDLCWRMQSSGYRIGIEPRTKVYHLGGGTLSALSPRKTMLNHRNNLAMLYKNLPLGHLLWVLPARLVLDGVAAASYLVKGQWACVKAVWQAHVGFYRMLPSLNAKRKAERAKRATLPRTIYRGSVIVRRLVGGKKFGKMM